jgi:hypothetical protein
MSMFQPMQRSREVCDDRAWDAAKSLHHLLVSLSTGAIGAVFLGPAKDVPADFTPFQRTLTAIAVAVFALGAVAGIYGEWLVVHINLAQSNGVTVQEAMNLGRNRLFPACFKCLRGCFYIGMVLLGLYSTVRLFTGSHTQANQIRATTAASF